MTSKTFDPKCWDLADHFLADVAGATDEDRTELAEEIQGTVEDFVSDLGCCRICAACPGFTGAECDDTCDHAKAGAA